MLPVSRFVVIGWNDTGHQCSFLTSFLGINRLPERSRVTIELFPWRLTVAPTTRASAGPGSQMGCVRGLGQVGYGNRRGALSVKDPSGCLTWRLCKTSASLLHTRYKRYFGNRRRLYGPGPFTSLLRGPSFELGTPLVVEFLAVELEGGGGQPFKYSLVPEKPCKHGKGHQSVATFGLVTNFFDHAGVLFRYFPVNAQKRDDGRAMKPSHRYIRNGVPVHPVSTLFFGPMY